MDRQYTDQCFIFNAVAANGASTPQNFASFQNIELQVAQVGFTGTIKFVGSNADVAPNFANAASASNPWDYVQCVDQIDGSAIAGATGIASVTVTSVRNLEVNVNAFKWIGAVISNFSAGSITVKARGASGI